MLTDEPIVRFDQLLPGDKFSIPGSGRVHQVWNGGVIALECDVERLHLPLRDETIVDRYNP